MSHIIPSLFLVGKLFCSSVGYQSGSGSAGGRDLPGADIIASWSVTLIRPYFSQRDHYQEPEETQECLQLPPLSQGSWVRREEFAGFAQKLGQTVLVLEVSNLDQEHCTPAVSWPWNSTESSTSPRAFACKFRRSIYIWMYIWNENIQKSLACCPYFQKQFVWVKGSAGIIDLVWPTPTLVLTFQLGPY